MRKLKRISLGLLGMIIFVLLGVYIWFWGRPVGINNYVNKAAIQLVKNSPEMLSSLGMIDNTPLDFHSNKLDDYTREHELDSIEQLKASRKGMDKYGPDGLEGQELLSYKIVSWLFDDLIAQSKHEFSGYPIHQLSGPAVDLPQFLTDTHAIKDAKSAGRYADRVDDFARVLKETEQNVIRHRDAGVVAPDFVLDKTLVGLRAFIEGGAAQNPLVTTLPRRLEKAEDMSDDAKADLTKRVTTSVADKVIPAYQSLIKLHEDMRKTATHDAGIWRIPNGKEIYQIALRSNTTTDMTADQIHNVGLSEVARLETEMETVFAGQDMTDGPLTERIQTLMKDPAQNFPDTDAGRAEMIRYLEELNTDVMAKAGDYFVTLPSADLEIVRVPEYSQDSAPGGYYSQPSIDGSRPGRFYINLKNTGDNPRWTLPTLLYHEAAPGHHFQITRSMMIEDVPILRQMSPFSAYTEGWALYAERMAAQDMGMYADDPLGDLGRLQAEMFRAVRLVVDTGMHAKKWSREDAVAYMLEKTGMSEAEVTREIERYVVWPGQATSYKTGQLAILDMRARAEKALGDKFILRDFNEMILADGAMPLGILDGVVDNWIAEQTGEAAK